MWEDVLHLYGYWGHFNLGLQSVKKLDHIRGSESICLEGFRSNVIENIVPCNCPIPYPIIHLIRLQCTVKQDLDHKMQYLSSLDVGQVNRNLAWSS